MEEKIANGGDYVRMPFEFFPPLHERCINIILVLDDEPSGDDERMLLFG